MKTQAELIEALAAELGRDPGDAWITSRAVAALARVRTYTGRHLWPRARFIDVWRATSARVLVLRQSPVSEILAASFAGVPVDPGALEVMDGGMVRRSGAVARTAQIEYRAGFDELPPEIFQVIAGALRGAQAAEASGAARKLSIVDVGSVEWGSGAGWAGDTGAGLPVDPILGPLVSVLDAFIDPVAGAYVRADISRLVIEEGGRQ